MHAQRFAPIALASNGRIRPDPVFARPAELFPIADCSPCCFTGRIVDIAVVEVVDLEGGNLPFHGRSSESTDSGPVELFWMPSRQFGNIRVQEIPGISARAI